jgi:MutS domain V
MNLAVGQVLMMELRLQKPCCIIWLVMLGVLAFSRPIIGIWGRNLKLIRVSLWRVGTDVEIGMKTMAVHVDEENREVTFLYKLVEGITEKSYGMNVAQMAGVPLGVVHRAEDAAREFELGSRLAKSLDRAGRGTEMSLGMQSDFAWLSRLAKETKDGDEDLLNVTRRLGTLLRVVESLE